MLVNRVPEISLVKFGGTAILSHLHEPVLGLLDVAGLVASANQHVEADDVRFHAHSLSHCKREFGCIGVYM